MRILGGMEVAEVAQTLGKRPGAVRALAFRGTRRLAQRLAAARVLTTAQRHGTVDPAATDLLDQAGDVVRAVAEGHSEETRKCLEELERKTKAQPERPEPPRRYRSGPPSRRPVQPGGAPSS